jgi:hypothetical protein
VIISVAGKKCGAVMYKKAIWLILSAVALIMVSNYLTGVFLPAFNPSNSDFSEIYASSWLWRQGQNPYDPVLATSARQHVVGGSDEIFLVNVPTALVLVAPFTLLPWGWAHLLFLMLGMAGLTASAFVILRLQGRSSWGLGTALVVVFLLSFSPLRIAFQWGNIILLVLPLSILAIMLAECRRDWQAGLLLGLTVCLKPQIGVWLGVYYLLRGRFRIVLSSLAIGLFVIGLFFLHPISYHSLIASCRSNLRHWFAPGGPYGVTGSMSSLVLRTQGIFYQLTHSAFASIWMAHILFLSGAVAWGILMWRFGDRIPSALAVAALLALSFLSLYHSIPDASVLTLSLCDAFPVSLRHWTRTQRLTCVLLSLMMLPGRSIFVLLYHHLNSSITESWWWDVFVVRYFVWLLMALSLTLLLRMREVQAEKS